MNISHTLIGKKLLILGANPETVPLIETAKKMGVCVLVTDNDPQAFAKPFANKSFNVDGMDVDGLVRLAQQENIDGVLVGVADRLILPYFEVCDALGLPCYATRDQCEYFTNKQKFNELCLKYNIKTIPNYNNEFNKKNSLLLIHYPVFVKPTDANSGKGMSICHNEYDLKIAVEKAKSFSKTNGFLIERYMQCDDMFIYYTFKDSEVFVSAIADRFTSDKQGDVSRVCIGANYPSKFIDLYFHTLHQNITQLFKDLKVQNGVFMISAFVENEEIYLYDPGFRLQGEAPNIPIEAVCGFDQKSMLVNFALTGSMGEIDLNNLNNPYFKNIFATTIWFLAKEGEIGEIKGIENLENDPCVIKIIQRLFVGDKVTKEMIGTEAQVFARMYLTSKSKNEVLHKVKYYQNKIQVFNSNKSQMLLGEADLK